MIYEDDGEEISPYRKRLMAENAAREKADAEAAEISRDIIESGREGTGKHSKFTISRRVDDFIGKNRIINPISATEREQAVHNAYEVLRGGFVKKGDESLFHTIIRSSGAHSTELAEDLGKISAVNMTKQVAEATGYLYHFAASDARESIAKSGFQSVTDKRHSCW